MENNNNYIDTWGITLNDLLIQNLQDEIALINPVVYENPIFTGNSNNYEQIIGQGNTNINSSNSIFNNITTSFDTIITGSNIDIGTLNSANTTFQYSPFYYSALSNLITNSNLYLNAGNTVSNLYAYSNASFCNCGISNIYMAQGSNLTITDNSLIYQINMTNANIGNYYSSNTNVSYIVASNIITSNVYSSNASNCIFNSSNAFFSTSNTIDTVNTVNAFTVGGNIKNFDVYNDAYIEYQPRVAIGANTVSFFFDQGAIPLSTTTYKLRSFMFDQQGKMYVTYIKNNADETYEHTLFRN